MKIFLGVPAGADNCLSVKTHETLAAGCKAAKTASHEVVTAIMAGSALVMNFNVLLAEAINRREMGEGFDAFVMLHTDIHIANPNWINELVGASEEHKLDVLSAFVAIKDDRGVTSTAIDTDPWCPRRITTFEMNGLPIVLTNKVAKARYGNALLLNTAVMFMRLGRSWLNGFHFTTRNAMAVGPDGQRSARFASEDWEMSRYLNANGVDYGAIQLPIGHIGGSFYSSGPKIAWGSQKVDEGNIIGSEKARVAPETVHEILPSRYLAQ